MKNIRLGNHYKIKYLSGLNFIFEEIQTQQGFIKSYEIRNKPNAQLYKGVLNILEDGRAIMNVNYRTYSNIKNKYQNFFNLDGLEIIHINNSTRIEKKYFNECV